MTEKKVLLELNRYIDELSLNEELESQDIQKIRKLIRVEIAEVLFDLFKKRGVWV